MTAMSEMFVLNDMLTRNKYVRTHAKEAPPDTAVQFEREKKCLFSSINTRFTYIVGCRGSSQLGGP